LFQEIGMGACAGANDAVAICEVMGRPNSYPVRVKTVEQRDIQAMHRVREVYIVKPN
jgi:transposase